MNTILVLTQNNSAKDSTYKSTIGDELMNYYIKTHLGEPLEV